MPHYFFHMTSGAHHCPDEKGLDQPDLAAAHRHALRLVHRIIRDVAHLGESERWAVRVGSMGGDPELIVLFPVRGFRHEKITADPALGGAVALSQRHA